MASTVKLEGMEGVTRVLKGLPGAVAKKWLRGAVGQGAVVVRDEARAQAPVRTGQLRRAIIMKYIAEKSSRQQVTYYVLARNGKKLMREARRTKKTRDMVGPLQGTGTNDAYYWRFLEFGTAKMNARPFMRPAFENKRMQALEKMIDYLREGVATSVVSLRNGGNG